MKTVTYNEFLTWNPCWQETPEGRRKLRYYAQKRERWSALDILNLNRVPAKDRLWAVLREELIDAPILHEFACRCAEMALELIPEPDPRSVAAIEAKRKWLRGEITDEELAAAEAAAEIAARYAEIAARYAECAARYAASVAARDAARAAECAAARAAEWAAVSASEWGAASVAARDAARKNQVTILKQHIWKCTLLFR